MFSLQDAKNKFSAVVEAALNGQPQQVSRRGKPAVVVVAVEEYERLVRAAQVRRGSFADHLMDMPFEDADGETRAKAQPRDVAF